MDTQVSDITSIPAPSTSLLKKLAKRTLLATLVVGGAALVYVKATQPAVDDNADRPQFN